MFCYYQKAETIKDLAYLIIGHARKSLFFFIIQNFVFINPTTLLNAL